jgi:hypothetical protein
VQSRLMNRRYRMAMVFYEMIFKVSICFEMTSFGQ